MLSLPGGPCPLTFLLCFAMLYLSHYMSLSCCPTLIGRVGSFFLLVFALILSLVLVIIGFHLFRLLLHCQLKPE